MDNKQHLTCTELQYGPIGTAPTKTELMSQTQPHYLLYSASLTVACIKQ